MSLSSHALSFTSVSCLIQLGDVPIFGKASVVILKSKVISSAFLALEANGDVQNVSPSLFIIFAPLDE